MTELEIKRELDQCTGTEQYYRTMLPKAVANDSILYTDGIKLMAKLCKAYWLIDLIVSYQDKFLTLEEFQVWKLQKHDDNSCTVVCDDGNGNLLRQQFVEYTDFPLKDIKIYVDGGVILLPSEY